MRKLKSCIWNSEYFKKWGLSDWVIKQMKYMNRIMFRFYLNINFPIQAKLYIFFGSSDLISLFVSWIIICGL